MRLGIVRLGVLALLVFDGGALAAQSSDQLAYAPGRARYRLTTTVHRNQMQGGGRAPFEFDVTTTQFVTVDLAPQSRDTLRLTITLDSVDVSSDLAAPPPDVHRLFGRKVTGLISPQGRVYQFDPPASDSGEKDTRDLYNAFRRFLVPLPTEPLKVGTSWVDTTQEKVHRNGFDVVATAITTSRVAGDTVVNGEHVWRIARRGELTQDGESKEAGKTIHLTGEGSVTGTHLLTHDGRYVGSESTQRFDITMTMAGSESAPISQTIKSKVERLTKS